MGELTTPVPREVIERWSGRWRYPTVAAAVSGDNPGDLIAPLLAGLARPASDPSEAVDRLLAEGEFDAAESLDAAHDRVANGRASAVRAVTRAVADLRVRAQRVGLRQPDCGALLDKVARRSDAADKWLRDQFEEVAKREKVYGQALEAEAERKADRSQAWLDAVKQCIADMEYPAARLMVSDGPGQEDPPDPAAVAQPPAWPFTDSRLPTVLSWYAAEAIDTPVAFGARWRPAPDDATAYRMTAAMTAVEAEVSPATVVELAAAIDAIAGVEGVRHPVVGRGDGFTVTLSGLASPLFRRLALAAEYQLWVPATPDADVPTDVTDLVVYGSSESLPDGVPQLRPVDLLRLIAPDADGRPHPVTYRQINLIRLLGSRLSESRIWLAERVGEEADRIRDDLRWTLNLLGLHHTSSVVDALMYDLSARPDAIAVALRQIVPPPDDRYSLTIEDLAAWREDEARMTGLRRGVAAALEADGTGAAVFYALVSRADDGADDVDRQEVADTLDELTRIGASDSAEVPADELLAAFDLGAAVTAAVDRSLAVRTGERLRLRPGGLPALFTAQDKDPLPKLTYHVLLRAHYKGREQERREARYKKILTDIMHSQKVITKWLSEMIAKLDDPDGMLSPEDRADLEARRDEMIEQLRGDQELGVSLDQAKLVKRSAVDIGEILRKVRRRVLSISPPKIQTEVWVPATPCLVWANPYDLEHSFFGIAQNAIRAIVSTGRLSGSVEINAVADDLVTIWIKDSGPGVPVHQRDLLWSPERRAEAGMKGIGLVYARDTMTHLGGTLDLDVSSAGGATFVVRLPLHRPVHHFLNRDA